MRFVMFGLIALIGLVGCQQNREKKIWPQDDLVVRANDDASKIAHRHWTVVSKKEAELGKFRERGIIVVLKYDYDKPGLAKLTPGTTLHLEIFHSHRFLAEFDGLKEGDSIWLLHLSGVDTTHQKYASAFLAPKCPDADKMYEKQTEAGGY